MTPATLAVLAALAAVPCAVVTLVRRGQPEHPRRASAARLAGLSAGLWVVLMGAHRLDGLPLALAVVGLMLALLGIGIGVRPLYAFLYGATWLAAHPGVEQRDVDRWQRLTLIGAVVCLALALVAALLEVDVASTAALGGSVRGAAPGH